MPAWSIRAFWAALKGAVRGFLSVWRSRKADVDSGAQVQADADDQAATEAADKAKETRDGWDRLSSADRVARLRDL